jgi:RNA polymerase sigma factor (sigma-70 family)
MRVKRSCTLPEDGSRTDWVRREAEVGDLADLSGVLGKLNEPNPPRTRVVRWQNLPDADLVALARAGQMDAFDPLYRRYAKRVLANAVRRAEGNQAWAEEIASEVWAAAIEKIGEYQGTRDNDPESFLHWLFGITRGQIARSWAVRRHELTFTPAGDWTEIGRPVGAEPDGDEVDNPVKAQLLDTLVDAVRQLAPRQRKVVTLLLKGLSYDEIADKTGQTAREVRIAWQTAQDTLRRRLADPIQDADPARLRAAVEKLPPLQRDVARLRLDGVRDREVAQRLGIEYTQVRNKWSRAKNALQRLLAEPSQLCVDEQKTACKAAVEQRDRDRLRKAAQCLPDGQRRVALLRLDGLLWREVDAALGISRGSGESIWRQAKKTFVQQGLMPA